MENPDAIVLWQMGFVKINVTLLFSWLVMLLLVGISRFAGKHVRETLRPGDTQNLLESIVELMSQQIAEVSQQKPGKYLPFIGTLFLYIATSNLLAIVPGYVPPTSSLSTTAALAFCVLVAVPFFGITSSGVKEYLRNYVTPSVFMLPFNILGEITRTLALAVRLYGNMLSGTVVGAILLSLVPFFVPVVMQLLGLLTGMIQAYIFSILAMVYIASAERIHQSVVQNGAKGQE